MKPKNLWQILLFAGLIAIGILLLSTPALPLKALGLLLIGYALAGIRVIYEYERGILFTLGKYSGLLMPGLIWFMPVIQRVRSIDLRIRSVDIPEQEVITKDNVPVSVNGVVFFKVEHPEKAVLNVEDYETATILYSQTVLRDVIGNVELDELLQKREHIGRKIRTIVDTITDEWGIDVHEVRLQDIIIPQDIKRAISRQAEAEREKRAVILKAEGELKASEQLREAAARLAEVPESITLRVLHTLADISGDPNQKVVILLPTDLGRKLSTL